MENTSAKQTEKRDGKVGQEQAYDIEPVNKTEEQRDTLNGNDFLRNLLSDEISEGM